ncbi:DNA polymerase III subunit delta' [Candidatus Pacearchaeota archaeon]|nr:MAG: DNA polymerase III subunit delta' [Candidatus Pacearchaeota archaeon]
MISVKNLNDILNQESAVNLLKLAIKKDRISHAYLFTGPKGVGKETTAQAFLYHLYCKENPENPCGSCIGCKKIDKNIHPDILKILPEKKEITIKQIREVNSYIRYGPIEGRYKVIIIKDAEKMNAEASNALLKSLEEPPSYVIFILLCENFSQLLPTIVSRSQIVRFRNLPNSVIAKVLKKYYFFEESVAETLAEISQGSLGRAIEIAEKGYLEELNSFVKAGISQSPEKKFRTVERLGNYSFADLEGFFYILSIWIWRSYLKNKLNYPYPKAFPEEVYTKEPFTALKLIYETRFAVEKYANSELALYRLMLKLFE